jgi:hypothetical protein
MPIPPDLRAYYPKEWPRISAAVRFERAQGRCEGCGRPHGHRVTALRDGRWYDPVTGDWMDADGERAPWPDIIERADARAWLVRLAACHRDHDPRNNDLANLLALCQRCHMIHDRPYHLMRRRLRHLLRYAVGDLFWGTYPRTPGAALPMLVRGG